MCASSARAVLLGALLAAAAAGCTKGGELKAGDCLVETESENPATYLVTQVSEGEVYGYKYINTEQGSETVEIDMTESYKKTTCPDVQAPPPPVE